MDSPFERNAWLMLLDSIAKNVENETDEEKKNFGLKMIQAIAKHAVQITEQSSVITEELPSITE